MAGEKGASPPEVRRIFIAGLGYSARILNQASSALSLLTLDEDHLRLGLPEDFRPGHLGCRGYGRVDLLCSDTENDVVLEVNTLPGFTPTSLLPKIAAQGGLDFAELTERILALATRDEANVTEAPAVGPIPVIAEPRRAVS